MPITIYGSSSSHIDPRFFDAARETGERIARVGETLVSGGGRNGLMAAAIEGARDAGGSTIGILPQFMVERCWQHPDLTEMIAVPDMHTRKAQMAAMARAVIALPGGIGTFEELMEIMTWRQLGLWNGEIWILNTLGYYDPILEMLRRAEDMGFMRKSAAKEGEDDSPLFRVATTPSEITL